MDLAIVEKWQNGPQVEIFYNSSERKLVFKKYNYVYTKGVDDLRANSYKDLQDYRYSLFSALFRSACFSPDEEFIAFQRNEENLEILSIENYQHVAQVGKNRKILGFYWIKNVPNTDLVLIDTNGVEFLKVQTPNLKLNSIKQYQMNVGHFWYSYQNRVLLVALAPPKLGQFSTFFYSPSGKIVQGVKFVLDLAPCVTDKWTIPAKNVTSLTWKEENPPESSPHEIALLNLYGLSYLAHMQSLVGVLKIYNLVQDDFSFFKEYKLKPGQYGIRCMDNLVLMQNYTLQETYVIDVKDQRADGEPYCTFWNNMKSDLPVISLKLRIFIEKPKVMVNSNVLYDSKPINDLKSFANSRSFGSVLESNMALNSNLVYVDHDVCVDINSGRCYKLKFSPLSAAENHSDKSASLLFLFRRKGLEQQAYEYLRHCIIAKSQLSSFFEAINNNFKSSMIGKKSSSNLRLSFGKSSDISTLRRSFSAEPEIKVEEGSVVISQDDLFSNVFKKVYEEGCADINYLAGLLQDYMRSLIGLDIEPKDDIQLFYAELLVSCNRHKSLLNMLSYDVFNDSFRLVKYLISLVHLDDNFLHFSVDMLFRLSAKERIIDVILERNFVYEAVQLLSKVQHPQFDLMKLLSKCQEMGNERLLAVVTQFIKSKSLS